MQPFVKPFGFLNNVSEYVLIFSQDESGVRKTSGGDEFIVELEGTRSISGNIVDMLDGQ